MITGLVNGVVNTARRCYSSFFTASVPQLMLQPEDQVIYHRIIELFKKECETRVYEATLCPQAKELCVYGLFFFQSRSWKEVEERLNKINSGDNWVTQWRDAWLKSIDSFRVLGSKVLTLQAQLESSQQKRHLANTVQLESDIKSTLVNRLRKLERCEKGVFFSPSNPCYLSIKNNPEADECLAFIKDHWKQLTIFKTIHSASIDKSEFLVTVRRSQLPVVDTIKEDTDEMICEAVPAVCLIQETKLEEVPADYDGEECVYITPKHLDVFHEGFLPAVDDELSDEIIHDIPFDGHSSSLLESRIRRIIQIAVAHINIELAKPSGL